MEDNHMETNLTVEILMSMMNKKILRTAETVRTDAEKKLEYVYSCELFISSIKQNSRSAVPELITITNEAVYNIGDCGIRNKMVDEFNLVNIYNCDLESEKFEHRCGTINLINTSVDIPRYKSLNAELFDSHYENECITWYERYTKEMNPNVDKIILEKANALKAANRIYRNKDGKICYEYRGACVFTEPFKIDSDGEQYSYEFLAVEE